MNSRIHPLIMSMALAAATTILMTGCSREATIAPSATVTPPISVGTEIDDTIVTTRVKAAMVGDLELKGADVKVETRKGVVQLSGFAETQAQVMRAIAVARAIDGVKDVENGMTLKASEITVGNKVDDSVITTKVKSVLLADASIKSFDIATVTSKGVVQLSGFVNNQGQIDQALKLTRAVEGVQSVANEMRIKK